MRIQNKGKNAKELTRTVIRLLAPIKNCVKYITIERQSLYIKILLLPLHSLTTSRKWNKADHSFVPRQILMFCPHSLTSESGQFTGL